jgi:dTDP-4-dehydrorhamnose 3,5-epimerase
VTVDIRELKVPDAYEFTPRQHGDDRGVFLEWFKEASFTEAVGHPLRLAQANTSVSARGVVRGIHFAQVPPGQAKYVTCSTGRVLDVVVDIRVGSPTFGTWDSVLLDDVDRRAIYLAEGLGHVFLALDDRSVVTYLCSEGYNPGREHGVHPLDREVGIAWPEGVEPVLSPKDAAAASLREAEQTGILPAYDECVAYYESLRRRGPGES